MSMSAGAKDDIVTGINVTPLVDVGLVLVIIFMVTAPLFEQPVLQVNLPKTTTKEGEEEENISITITPDGKMAVNQDEATQETLERILKKKLAASENKRVILRADAQSSHGDLLYAMKIAKDLGAKSMSIATEPKERNLPRKI